MTTLARDGPRRARLAVLIVLLAILAPIAVPVVFRLLMKQCAVLNLLGLPWPPVLEIATVIVGVAIIATSTFALIYGLATPGLRVVSGVMCGYSAIAAIPVMIVFFFLVYGDPGPNCVPV